MLPSTINALILASLGRPLALWARATCYRAAEDGRATEPADAVSAHAGYARSRAARCKLLGICPADPRLTGLVD